MTQTDLIELRNITSCFVVFLLLGWGFAAVVMRQDQVVETQTVEFKRRLAVSEQYDITMAEIRGE